MIDDLNKAINEYSIKWNTLLEERKNPSFFRALKPTAVAWKALDKAEYKKMLAELREMSDILVENWWDGRWIAMLHLRDIKLAGGIEVVKLMQRRPDSSDAVGIDHIDFYGPAVANANKVLKNEPNLAWTHEVGGLTKWISVWFSNTEAKLRTHTIIDSCIRDLSAVNEHLRTKERIPDFLRYRKL